MKRFFSTTLFGLIWAAQPALAAETGHKAETDHKAEAPAGHPFNPYTINSALQELKNGNRRFVDHQPTYPNQQKALRDKLSTAGQTPLAAILSCSDSRVPVELIFDLGFGDLFVIRDAGNVPGVDEVGSIEYAVEHLGVPLVAV